MRIPLGPGRAVVTHGSRLLAFLAAFVVFVLISRAGPLAPGAALALAGLQLVALLVLAHPAAGSAWARRLLEAMALLLAIGVAERSGLSRPERIFAEVIFALLLIAGAESGLSVRGTRRLVQLAVFVGFVALVLGTGVAAPLFPAVPSDFFLRTSPLIAAATMLASRTVVWTVLLPAAIVLLVTLLLGRAYCGWFCPMGTLIDLTERIAFRKRLARAWPQERSDKWRAVKYITLAALLGSALFTYQPLLMLDPIAFVHRSAALAVAAPLDTAAKDAQGALYKPLLKRKIRIDVPSERRTAMHGALALAMLATALGLSALQRRFWCRYLCPLGALLGLVSWIPLLRRRVTDSCTHCLRCERTCKMGCIDERGARYRTRECIDCYECEVCCPPGAVSFPIAHRLRECKPGMDRRSQLSRRRLLGGTALGAGWFLAQKSSWSGRMGAKHDRWKNPWNLRPPAALPEKDFLELCTRCGECIKVCPTNTLQPALFEAGAEGLFSPIVVPRIAECREKCNACATVCPTGAIQPFRIEDKNPRLTDDPALIGVATIDRNTCRAWYKNQKCSVCDEQCPYDAIASPVVDGMKRPFIIEQFCTGCGACERECPIEPTSAIRISNRGERRPILPRRKGRAADGFRRVGAEDRTDVRPFERQGASADEAFPSGVGRFQAGRELPPPPPPPPAPPTGESMTGGPQP